MNAIRSSGTVAAANRLTTKIMIGFLIRRGLCNVVDIPLTQLAPTGCGISFTDLDHRLVGFRWRIDGLLHEPEDEPAAALGLPTVEAKGEFIRIVR